ncbi:MAG: copper homeostasis protein CutC [Bacteroidetes bacterium]|nr:copper homeostasis protein CutC [Bacteroidota bacterium]
MLEIACFEMTSAELALQSVADRIEFCSEQSQGGLTPDLEELRYLKSKYNKPIHVMIRPVGGGFRYSDAEFEQMKIELLAFKDAGADGFVFGILTVNNEIDKERNSILVQLAGGLPCVFHRAIDRSPDIEKALEDLISIGFSEVLTSGGENTAMEGKEKLKEMQSRFGDKINILIGGGVRSNNIEKLREITKGNRYHSAAILPYESFVNVEEIKKLK